MTVWESVAFRKRGKKAWLEGGEMVAEKGRVYGTPALCARTAWPSLRKKPENCPAPKDGGGRGARMTSRHHLPGL